MPPRPAAGVASEPRDALALLPLALPLPLALRIWRSLPCDVRLRCREVCRAWRNALAEPCLWTELDLTETSGVTARITPALLLAAEASAEGELECLSVTYNHRLYDALRTVVTENADTLRHLRIVRGANGYCNGDAFVDLMHIMPQHCVVEADVLALGGAHGPMLRNEPPFQNLRLRALRFWANAGTDPDGMATALKAHASLCKVEICGVRLDTFAAVDVVVDAALALRLTTLKLQDCRIIPASSMALQRLLRDGEALQELSLSGGLLETHLLDAHVAPLLADALRSNRTLTSLTLHDMGLRRDPGAMATMLGGLVGHASLTSCTLQHLGGHQAEPILGPVFGALVAADSPLRMLDISRCMLGDVGMGPLVDALPRNTHLQELLCPDSGMSPAFVRDRLMPALRDANTSLRVLVSGSAEADAFVAARTAAAARS